MENKFVYVVWSTAVTIGGKVSFRPQYDMQVFPTYVSALRFVAFLKARERFQGWQVFRTWYNEIEDGNNLNMLVLELTYKKDLYRWILTRAPISRYTYNYNGVTLNQND